MRSRDSPIKYYACRSRVERRNTLKILVIGDVTSPSGIEHLKRNLWKFREQRGIDFCVVNGENAAFITGISPELAEVLLRSGADCITGGNHTLRNKRSYTYLDDTAEILRPINFGEDAPGHGYSVLDCNGYRILVINALGRVNMSPTLDSPFTYIDRLLQNEAGRYDFAILDIHAEATGEKMAVGYAYDGKINIVFGTHTHVPTADARILPGGTGYITDLGMCGESGGIMGMDPESVLVKMKARLPGRFKLASGPVVADGVIFTVDKNTKKTTDIERIRF